MNITLVKEGRQTIHKIPTKWNQVSLKKYVRIMKVLKEDNDSTLDKLNKTIKMLRILTDIPEKDILRLPLNNINILGSKLNELLSKQPNDTLKNIIRINGVNYGFHPKIADISFGEWVDIDSFINDGVDDNLHKILAVLYRPVISKKGDKYQIEPYEPCKKREEILLENLNVGDFYGVSVFFSDLGRELLSHTLKSSIQDLKEDLENQELEI